MRVYRVSLIAFAGALSLLPGCGNSRTAVPNLAAPQAPHGFRWLTFPAAGIAFKAPSSWIVVAQRAPLVTSLSSGTAVVAVWRFARSQPPPGGDAWRTQGPAALIRAARARDPQLRLIRSRAFTIRGVPAIELDAFELISGQPRRVRSTHFFSHGAELVLEEYAPPSLFHEVDHAVFSPVKRSVLLGPALAAAS